VSYYQRRHEWLPPAAGNGKVCMHCGTRRVRIKGHWVYRRTQLDLLTPDAAIAAKKGKGGGTKPKKKTEKSVPLKVTKLAGKVDLVECPPCEGSYASCRHLVRR